MAYLFLFKLVSSAPPVTVEAHSRRSGVFPTNPDTEPLAMRLAGAQQPSRHTKAL